MLKSYYYMNHLFQMRYEVDIRKRIFEAKVGEPCIVDNLGIVWGSRA